MFFLWLIFIFLLVLDLHLHRGPVDLLLYWYYIFSSSCIYIRIFPIPTPNHRTKKGETDHNLIYLFEHHNIYFDDCMLTFCSWKFVYQCFGNLPQQFLTTFSINKSTKTKKNVLLIKNFNISKFLLIFLFFSIPPGESKRNSWIHVQCFCLINECNYTRYSCRKFSSICDWEKMRTKPYRRSDLLHPGFAMPWQTV